MPISTYVIRAWLNGFPPGRASSMIYIWFSKGILTLLHQARLFLKRFVLQSLSAQGTLVQDHLGIVTWWLDLQTVAYSVLEDHARPPYAGPSLLKIPEPVSCASNGGLLLVILFAIFRSNRICSLLNFILVKCWGGNNNTVLPVYVGENHLQYHTNASNQLQLFGNLPVGCNVDPVNYCGNEHDTPILHPNKQVREAENISRQQKLEISLNYNVCHDETDRSASIPNQNPVSTGLRLSYDDDERNSSVTSASGSMTTAPPIILAFGDNIRTELDRQKEELDQFIKIQEENLAKGVRDIKQRHMASFLTSIEKGVSRKLCEKDVEIEDINRKNRELVEKIKQVAAEAQNWHYRAKYNESVVNVLKNNLRHAISQGADQGKEGFGDSENRRRCLLY
ncbi:SBP (S-ribonuclease binding protein) family protein [Actinidia rufa]|uniref:SBP (S-ribonuclease binding protein) family protein n=1 Tax=Actinidia rufa TaxID=165716 RepID=A0A7J0F9M8_9ERIC|nr:SBP (S-ribonuclease binding protein) family protein [Actinidia rufa]